MTESEREREKEEERELERGKSVITEINDSLSTHYQVVRIDQG